MIHRWISCTMLCMYFSVAHAQESEDTLRLTLGKPLPFSSVGKIYELGTDYVDLTKPHGKAIILDFWSEGCSSCIASFPLLNHLQEVFKDQVHIILVGQQHGKIQEVFKAYRKKYQLHLAYAFDSAAFPTLGLESVPRSIFITPTGTVGAVGGVADLDSTNIAAFIQGKPITLHFAPSKTATYDFFKPLLLGSNGGADSDFLFRSVLTGFLPNVAPIAPTCIRESDYPHHIFVGNADLYQLYNLAFGDTVIPYPYLYDSSSYGTFWDRPVLELTDASLFDCDFNRGKNYFCYGADIPPKLSSTQRKQSIMQRDLTNYFGFTVTVEEREMPCLNLIATKAARTSLATKGGQQLLPEMTPSLGFKLQNAPVAALICEIYNFHQNTVPMYDNTGIKGNVDVNFVAFMTDWDDILRALHTHGLDFQKSTHRMKVIVLRDPPKDALHAASLYIKTAGG